MLIYRAQSTGPRNQSKHLTPFLPPAAHGTGRQTKEASSRAFMALGSRAAVLLWSACFLGLFVSRECHAWTGSWPSPGMRPARSLSLVQKARSSLVVQAAEMAEAEAEEEAEKTDASAGTADALRLPLTVKQQNDAVVAAVQRAREAGITRQRVRILVPREGNLRPPDETWQGGIMELYFAITPVVKDFLRALAPRAAGVPARLVEQRLDASGVDGESLWMAQVSPLVLSETAIQPSSRLTPRFFCLACQGGQREG